MDKNETRVPGEKVIFHLDGDAFFVACEIAKNPKLKGLPVVTGEERGIVSALSYEAKALGIVRGLPIFQLRKKFPQVLVLPGDYESYVEYSQKMFDVVRKYIDVVEEYSIDECFADLTGHDKPLYMTYREIAEKIKKEVTENYGLSISVGLGPTKVLAKVASKWQKPNGLTIITKNNAREFLDKTPIEKIWGIGRRTSGFLQGKGILTAQDFVEKPLSWVKEYLSLPYQTLWLELNGIQILSIDPNPKTTYKSIQKTRTFRPATDDKDFLLSQLSKHTEDACKKARYYNLSTPKVSFFLKNKDFRYFTYTFTLPNSSSSPEIILGEISRNFTRIWRKGELYRSTGVILHELLRDGLVQTDLFGLVSGENKLGEIHKQIDRLDEKFGKRTVYLASTHKAIKRKVSGTDSDDLDRNLLFM